MENRSNLLRSPDENEALRGGFMIDNLEYEPARPSDGLLYNPNANYFSNNADDYFTIKKEPKTTKNLDHSQMP